jgi:hypothetical protein
MSQHIGFWEKMETTHRTLFFQCWFGFTGFYIVFHFWLMWYTNTSPWPRIW